MIRRGASGGPERRSGIRPITNHQSPVTNHHPPTVTLVASWYHVAVAGVRIVVFGTAGVFSLTVLRRLLAAGVEPVGLVVPGRAPGPRGELPVEVAGASETVVTLARARGLTVFEWDIRSAKAEALARLAPDLILIACFPHRLPPAVTALARVACLNLHPSLLPRYRGPAPLFWQLRAGERDTGVTLHHVDERLDAGDVVSQRRADLADGLSGSEVDSLLAGVGADLVLAALDARPTGAWPRRAQDEAQATAQRWPRPQDFEVSTLWPARRAFNFMRGTAEWGCPYEVRAGTAVWSVRIALGYDPTAELGAPRERRDGHARIQFSPGVLDVVQAPTREAP